MAYIHQSEITPSKLELVQHWLPTQPWFTGDIAGLGPHAAYRFDDPDGEVGIESLLLSGADGAVVQIPLTYRGAPLAGGGQHLVGEMEHSALGHRWVYDALGDPVAVAAFATAARTGGHEAELVIEVDGVRTLREPTARVSGSGTATAPVLAGDLGAVAVAHEDGTAVVTADGLRLVLHRFPATAEPRDGAAAITGTWAGQDEPALLAEVTAV